MKASALYARKVSSTIRCRSDHGLVTDSLFTFGAD